MRETDGQKQPELRRRPWWASAEIGAVRVFFNPGPDAEDRLRRLVSLMIRYAAKDRQAGEQRDRLHCEPDAEAES